jgi:hypothetical protein
MRKIALIFAIIFVVWGCRPENKQEEFLNVPYPPNEDILYYQSEVDNGYQPFWTDIKATASAYLNNSKYAGIEVAPDDIIIVGEGIFHGTIDVEMPDYILELKMERPNKSKGRQSIWQVISVKEKPWPNNGSKSKKSK